MAHPTQFERVTSAFGGQENGKTLTVTSNRINTLSMI